MKPVKTNKNLKNVNKLVLKEVTNKLVYIEALGNILQKGRDNLYTIDEWCIFTASAGKRIQQVSKEISSIIKSNNRKNSNRTRIEYPFTMNSAPSKRLVYM